MPTTTLNIELELLRTLIQTGGVLLGALIAGCVALLLHMAKARHEDQKERENNERELKLASVIVSDRLAIFLKGCLSVAADDGTDERGQPAGRAGFDEFHSPTSKVPLWEPGSIAVQWKYLDPHLVDQLFKLSLLVDEANLRISGAYIQSDPPEYYEFFIERRLRYADLGMRSINLREQVIANAGLTDEGMPKQYDGAAQSFESTKARLTEMQNLREKRRSEIRFSETLHQYTESVAMAALTGKQEDEEAAKSALDALNSASKSD